jgi:hypothetical protein
MTENQYKDYENLSEETFRDLWMDEWFDTVEDNIDDSWRHGNNHTTIFRLIDRDNGNKPTDIYYQAFYQVDGTGEYHGIRDASFEIRRVKPVVETKMVEVTTWVKP